MAARSKLTLIGRLTAFALAVAWIGGGVMGLVLGVIHRHLILVVLSVPAMWYGAAWLRVAILAHRLTSWREFLVPWRTL